MPHTECRELYYFNELDATATEKARDWYRAEQFDYARTLQEEIEYLSSNEAVDEAIIANEYEFTKEGRRA